MTGAIPIVTPACLKQASRMGEGLLTLDSHYKVRMTNKQVLTSSMAADTCIFIPIGNRRLLFQCSMGSCEASDGYADGWAGYVDESSS